MHQVKRNKTEACRSGMHRYGMMVPGILENYLTGKKVIVVGPAGYLTGQENGEFIDSFDVVVRINHSVPVRNEPDYGSRTDVLYHILSRLNSFGGKKKLVGKDEVDLWQSEGVKYLISRHGEYSSRIRELKFTLRNMPWQSLGDGFYLKIKRQIGSKNPNTGVLAIMHLLKYEVKSVNVMGFDFYRSGVHKGYGDIKDGQDAERVNSKWHDTNAQIRFLKRVAKEEKRLIFDEVLEGIINEVED